jgi:hypothetical protein
MFAVARSTVRCTDSMYDSVHSVYQAALITEQRYINFLPTLAFGAMLLATWEAISVSYQAALLNGGPVRKLSTIASRRHFRHSRRIRLLWSGAHLWLGLEPQPQPRHWLRWHPCESRSVSPFLKRLTCPLEIRPSERNVSLHLPCQALATYSPLVDRWTILYAPPGVMTPAFWGLIQGWITVCVGPYLHTTHQTANIRFQIRVDFHCTLSALRR